VMRCGLVLQYASAQMKADPAIVLAAVTQCGLALQYASKAMKANRKVVLTAVYVVYHFVFNAPRASGINNGIPQQH
jgi:hypothetical protein